MRLPAPRDLHVALQHELAVDLHLVVSARGRLEHRAAHVPPLAEGNTDLKMRLAYETGEVPFDGLLSQVRRPTTASERPFSAASARSFSLRCQAGEVFFKLRNYGTRAM